MYYGFILRRTGVIYYYILLIRRVKFGWKKGGSKDLLNGAKRLKGKKTEVSRDGEEGKETMKGCETLSLR